MCAAPMSRELWSHGESLQPLGSEERRGVMIPRHSGQVVAGVAAWLAIELAFELLRPRGLTFDGLWQARLGIATGVLLLANLVVVWWYADLTRRLAESSSEQVEMGRDQREHERMPCVVVEWQYLPPRIMPRPGGDRMGPAGHTWVARNIGRGIALNVVHVEDLESDELKLLHVGSLDSGGKVELPDALVERLNAEEAEPLQRRRHVLIAEPLGGDEWFVTENRVERGGRVSHRVRSRKLSREQINQIHRQAPGEYIHANWPAIQADLRRMLAAGGPIR